MKESQCYIGAKVHNNNKKALLYNEPGVIVTYPGRWSTDIKPSVLVWYIGGSIIINQYIKDLSYDGPYDDVPMTQVIKAHSVIRKQGELTGSRFVPIPRMPHSDKWQPKR